MMRPAAALVAATVALANAASLTEKPIVGILSQPLSEDDDRPCALLFPAAAAPRSRGVEKRPPTGPIAHP